MASEILKSRVHRGLSPSLYFFRDRKGSEVDLVIEDGGSLIAVETKSGQTIAGDFFAGLESFLALAAESHPNRRSKSFLVYGGRGVAKAVRGRGGLLVGPRPLPVVGNRGASLGLIRKLNPHRLPT